MRGDVLDLAVGVVIGSAFTSIVNQVVQGLITPLIGWIVAMITGTSDLEGALSILDWSPTKGVTFAFGNVISAIITFLITGFVLFLVVKAANRAKNYAPKKQKKKWKKHLLQKIILVTYAIFLPNKWQRQYASGRANKSFRYF